ncbi:MAG: hypothetical protein M3463_09420 [Verrucomicrobiota bacterium]|nr:hypothetical protein [Verrucomicrobiota bacterium]
MSLRRKRSKDHELPASPIDARKKALAEEEARLHAEIERRQRLIEEAPQIAREQERRRREELIARASRTEARFASRATLADTRHGYSGETGLAPRRRPLRRERTRGMLTFFVLLLVFLSVLCWVYYAVIQPL